MLRTLRSKVLAILSFLMLVSLAGVGVSFYITQQVNAKLDEINRRSVPMQRELAQLTTDTELLHREMDRSLGFIHWKDPRWKPRRIPLWVLEVHRSTLARFKTEYFNAPSWRDWHSRLEKMNDKLSQTAEALFLRLQEQNFDRASEIYPEWVNVIDLVQKEVAWAKREMDRNTRDAFQGAQNDVKNLRLALQVLLMVVIGVSLLILWMGERALRPIGRLRKIVHQITVRGELTPHDKAGLPQFSLSQHDEVSDLAREFHQMATSLLEREKMVLYQKEKLEEQNRQLSKLAELQKRLQQAEHLAAVGRMSAQVAHEVGNPLHSIGLEAELALDLIQPHQSSLKQSLQTILMSVERLQKTIQNYLRLSKLTPDHRTDVDLKVVIEQVLATYANSCENQGVKVNWYFDTNAPKNAQNATVKADADLLEYAIGNLMRNSLQALEGKNKGEGKIDLMVSVKENSHSGPSTVQILFSDNGPGLSEEVKQNIFKPFFTTKAQGTGLGLSFVKKVFDDLGGTFTLGSSQVGVGTVFVGNLPALIPPVKLQHQILASQTNLPEANA